MRERDFPGLDIKIRACFRHLSIYRDADSSEAQKLKSLEAILALYNDVSNVSELGDDLMDFFDSDVSQKHIEQLQLNPQ